MEASEAAQVLMVVKGIWYRQPGDPATSRIWAELLGLVELRDALDYVRGRAQDGTAEPPTPGQIYAAAWAAQVRRGEHVRSRQRKLAEPARTAVEIAAARALLASYWGGRGLAGGGGGRGLARGGSGSAAIKPVDEAELAPGESRAGAKTRKSASR